MIPKKTKKRKSVSQYFFGILLGTICLSAVLFLVVSNWRVSQRRSELNSQIKDLQIQIQELQEKNSKLKAGIDQSQSQEYLEQVAREDLDYKKPGEGVVVVKGQATSSEEAMPKDRGLWQLIRESFGF